LQAAAAMDVHVGSFSDPDGLQGLAHFLGNYDSLNYRTAKLFIHDGLRAGVMIFIMIAMIAGDSS